jgi:UDP-GlcNAc:undecaprenyl-phosphate GlcNAc-1-phosphate transferase
MARNGLSPRASLVWVAALCSMSAMGAALSIITSQSEYAIASIGMVLAVMIFGNVFAVAEFNLVTRKIKSMMKSVFVMKGKAQADRATHSSVQLQGHYDWEEMWCRLKEFATESELNQIMLDVNAPWLHEGFHADWVRKGVKGGTSNQWRVELPMVVEGRVFARIVVQAPRDGRFTHHEVVVNLMKITADLEQELASLTSSAVIRVNQNAIEEAEPLDSHENHPAHS